MGNKRVVTPYILSSFERIRPSQKCSNFGILTVDTITDLMQLEWVKHKMFKRTCVITRNFGHF